MSSFQVGAVRFNGAHSEDSFLVRKLDGSENLFIAVADGISSSSRSAEAAERAVALAWRAVLGLADFSIDLFVTKFRDMLSALESGDEMGAIGQTTLTACLFSRDEGGACKCDFMAIGDSPIYHFYRGDIDVRFPGTFLCEEVHGRPFQYLNAGSVYARVDMNSGCIEGRVVKGRRYVESGDIVVIATDGLPMTKYLLDLRVGGRSHVFLNEVATGELQIKSEELFNKIEREGGFSDDATMVVVRIEEELQTNEVSVPNKSWNNGRINRENRSRRCRRWCWRRKKGRGSCRICLK